eukprot:1139077-Pelagomonas_calceolata.AAC.12
MVVYRVSLGPQAITLSITVAHSHMQSAAYSLWVALAHSQVQSVAHNYVQSRITKHSAEVYAMRTAKPVSIGMQKTKPTSTGTKKTIPTKVEMELMVPTSYQQLSGRAYKL